jgi:hypothetical protein
MFSLKDTVNLPHVCNNLKPQSIYEDMLTVEYTFYERAQNFQISVVFKYAPRKIGSRYTWSNNFRYMNQS